MEIVAKIYEHYRSSVILDQIQIKSKLSIEDELGNFWTADFDATSLSLVEYNKIELYEAGSPDTLVFKGLVHQPLKEITALKNKTQMVCRSEMAIMLSRKVLVARTKTDTIENIINELLWDYNSLWENRTSQIDLTKTVTIDYKIWDVYFWIFNELSLQWWWYWTIENAKIIMKELLGTDRTYWSWLTEIILDKTHDSNVSSLKIVGLSTRANIVVGVDYSKNTVTKQDMSWGVIYWVHVETFRDGDLADKTQQLLDRMNIRQRVLNLDIDPNKNISANIGDKLHLRIENVDNMEDISSDILVVKKEIVYDFWQKKVLLTVWENLIQEDSLWNILVNIKRDVDRQKI